VVRTIKCRSTRCCVSIVKKLPKQTLLANQSKWAECTPLNLPTSLENEMGDV
jgi:hypothetical protein